MGMILIHSAVGLLTLLLLATVAPASSNQQFTFELPKTKSFTKKRRDINWRLSVPLATRGGYYSDPNYDSVYSSRYSEEGIGTSEHFDYDNRNTSPQSQRYSYSEMQAPSGRGVEALFKQAGTASIGLLFVLLIWRALSAYEMASQFESSTVRTIAVVPVLLIMLANLAGFVVNLMKPMNFKNVLKAILAGNILREWFELVFNAVMMLITSSSAIIPREVYFGRLFMNVWWSIICFSFSKSRWVLQPTLPSSYQQHYAQYAQQQYRT